MKSKDKDVQGQKPLTIHTLLFAIFPVLYLYATNIAEVNINQVLFPLAASIALAAVIWAFLYLLYRDMIKSMLATSVFLLLFFTYGHIIAWLEPTGFVLFDDRYLLPTVLLLYGYGIYFIKIARTNFVIATKALNIAAATLIIFNLFAICIYQVKHFMTDTGSLTSLSPYVNHISSASENKTRPDIYHIVLDEYAGAGTIKEYFGYDNSLFIQALEAKGFHIDTDIRTYSVNTPWVLASILNMQYVSDNETIDVVHQLISNNKVAKYLKSEDYKLYYIGAYHQLDDTKQYDFTDKEKSGRITSEFLRILWNTTMLRPFYAIALAPQYSNMTRAEISDEIQLLKSIAVNNGPKYVFAHILCPHVPFVFGSGGEFVDTQYQYEFVNRQYYLGQYIYITREIEKVVDVLTADRGKQPVIIIQSDHGPRQLGTPEAQKIFYAYYLPGDTTVQRKFLISPIYTYPMIFNYIFGAGFYLPGKGNTNIIK